MLLGEYGTIDIVSFFFLKKGFGKTEYEWLFDSLSLGIGMQLLVSLNSFLCFARVFNHAFFLNLVFVLPASLAVPMVHLLSPS